MSYVAGIQLSFEIPLVDGAGNSVDATAVSYSVLDGSGVTLLGSTVLGGYVTGTDAVIAVPAQHNTLVGTERKAAREILLVCTTATGNVTVTRSYVIEALTGTLVRGLNTFVTLATADMLSAEIPELTTWTSASRDQRVMALTEAYRRIAKLRIDFNKVSINNNFSRAWFGNLDSAGVIEDLESSEVLALDAKLYTALSYAQVAEADAIISGDADDEKRRAGLILDTIGEVKQMYRSGKPLDLPVSRKALRYVSSYVNMGSKPVARVC